MSDMLGNRESGIGNPRRECPIVQRLRSNFNVTSRSVEMAAQKFYTDAKFGWCGKLPRHNTNGDWACQG